MKKRQEERNEIYVEFKFQHSLSKPSAHMKSLSVLHMHRSQVKYFRAFFSLEYTYKFQGKWLKKRSKYYITPNVLTSTNGITPSACEMHIACLLFKTSFFAGCSVTYLVGKHKELKEISSFFHDGGGDGGVR